LLLNFQFGGICGGLDLVHEVCNHGERFSQTIDDYQDGVDVHQVPLSLLLQMLLRLTMDRKSMSHRDAALLRDDLSLAYGGRRSLTTSSLTR
jgi:hypothetical protein